MNKSKVEAERAKIEDANASPHERYAQKQLRQAFNKELWKLAKKYPAPQEWYDE